MEKNLVVTNPSFEGEDFVNAPVVQYHDTMVSNVQPDFVTQLQEESSQFCSMRAETFKEKAQLFNAINTNSERLADHINEVINVKDVFCEEVECRSEQTGLLEKCPRIVLIDTENKGYTSVSFGVFSSLRKLFMPNMLGLPTWEGGVPLKIKQIKKDKKSILTLEVAWEQIK